MGVFCKEFNWAIKVQLDRYHHSVSKESFISASSKNLASAAQMKVTTHWTIFLLNQYEILWECIMLRISSSLHIISFFCTKRSHFLCQYEIRINLSEKSFLNINIFCANIFNLIMKWNIFGTLSYRVCIIWFWFSKYNGFILIYQFIYKYIAGLI